MNKAKRVLRILSIDDDPNCNLAASRYLTLVGGHQVDVAENGVEGIRKAGQLRPDMILLDMNMPDMNGLQVIEILGCNPDMGRIPVIIVTGAELTEPEKCSLKLKPNFLELNQKPVNFATLLAKIERKCLDLPRSVALESPETGLA